LKAKIDKAKIADKIFNAVGPIVYIPELDELRSYGEGIYIPALNPIRGEIRKRCRNANRFIIEEILSHLRDTQGHSLKEFDAKPEILNLRNGLLNLRTGKFVSHQPKYLSLCQLPIEYDPKAKCPNIDRFLHEIAKPEDVSALYEIAGYCLWRFYPIQVFVFLLGDGSNGKSTYLSLLRAFLGKENVSHVTIQGLANNRFSPAELQGKFANLSADIPSRGLLETGMVKSLVGGDAVTVERKYGHPFSFINYAKLIFSGNQLPASPDESDAWFRRYFSIDFPHEFSKAKGNMDPETLAKLTTAAELSGLLNVALDSLLGRKGLLERKEFTGTKSLEAQRHDYRMRSDSVYAFSRIQLVFDPEYEAWLPKQEVYEGYLKFCAETKRSPLSQRVFYEHLSRIVPVEDYYASEREEGDRERRKAWKGIRWVGSVRSTYEVTLESTKDEKIVGERTGENPNVPNQIETLP